MPELFVSYASVDRARTMQIVEAVQAQGFEVWIDQAGIAGGTAYGTEIASALRDAAAFLLIASDASLASKNVRQEIMLAWRYDKPIIPLILHPLVFPDDVAYWLEGAQWIEVLDSAEDAWIGRLRQSLARHGLGTAHPDAQKVGVELVPLVCNGNLPSRLLPIVGRTREIEELLALLGNGRLITLTGVGGTGKTRLALEAAQRLAPSFSGGAWFIDLASVTSPKLILSTIASELGVVVAPGQLEVEALAEHLGETALLLVLDNLEQIVGAAAPIEELLSALPGATILATSRAPLGLSSEWAYAVPQLALPNLSQLPPPAELKLNPAVGLFVDRATLAKPDFQLNDGNARAVAEICHRLDGLPLAIEIAAARTRLLPPAAMLPRLGSRLNLLTRGPAATVRQQTLRDTIGWSYDLLDPVQQRVFRLFAVFMGGAQLETTEALLGALLGDGRTDAAPVAVVDVVEDLIDQALIAIDHQTGPTPRLRMLETIREYALEQLVAQGEAAGTREAHANYFAQWLDGIVADLSSASAGAAVTMVRGELGNLRGALHWSKAGDDPVLWWRLANMLFAYWRIDGPYAEAEGELRAVVEAVDDDHAVERADALGALGWLAGARGAFREADSFFTQALAIYEAANRPDQVAKMHYQLAVSAEWTGDYEEARRHHLAQRAFHEQQGDEHRVAQVEHDLGRIASYEGDYSTAIGLIKNSLAAYRRAGDVQLIAGALHDLATVEMFAGDGPASLSHIGESLALMRTFDDPYLIATATATQARVQQLAGDFEAAARTILEAQAAAEALGDANLLSLVLYTKGTNALGLGELALAERYLMEDLSYALEHEDRWRVCEILERLATICVATGRPEQSASLLGRAVQERDETGGQIPPVNLPEHAATVAAARAELGDARFEELWEEGRTLDVQELVVG